MKLGVIADIDGNDVALRAVREDAGRFGVERWWALGDLVLFGPRPAEVHEILRGLPGTGMLRGNTDRYVPGIEPGIDDEELGPLLDGSGADVVIGGHTHSATDRLVGGIRALNPGSTGLPRPGGTATWLLLEDSGEGLAVTHHAVPFDVAAVV